VDPAQRAEGRTLAASAAFVSSSAALLISWSNLADRGSKNDVVTSEGNFRLCVSIPTVTALVYDHSSPGSVACSRPSLEPDFSTANRSADRAQDPQDDADHNEDSADGVEDRQTGEVTNQQQDDAEHDHGDLRFDVGTW